MCGTGFQGERSRTGAKSCVYEKARSETQELMGTQAAKSKNELTTGLSFFSPSLITGSIPGIPKVEREEKLLQVVLHASRGAHHGRQLLQKLNECKHKQEKEDLHKF